jgi:hypothetical protein
MTTQLNEELLIAPARRRHRATSKVHPDQTQNGQEPPRQPPVATAPDSPAHALTTPDTFDS